MPLYKGGILWYLMASNLSSEYDVSLMDGHDSQLLPVQAVYAMSLLCQDAKQSLYVQAFLPLPPM